jgi:hypothetical protein
MVLKHKHLLFSEWWIQKMRVGVQGGISIFSDILRKINILELGDLQGPW